MYMNRYLVSLAAFAALAVSAFPSQASDGKNYAGSACVRYGGTSTPTYLFSAIGNPSSTTWLYVDCPVVKDAVNIRNGWVRMVDQNFNEDISCSLNSFYRSEDGAFLGWWTARHSSSGTNAGVQHVTFDGIGSNSVAHYYYSCRIPPRFNGQTSYITSYHVRENE